MKGDATAPVGLDGFASAPAPLQLAGVLFVLLGLMLTLSACGSSDEGSSATRPAGAQNPADAADRFGKDAPPAQARQAEAVVADYLAALAGEQWRRACSYLARSTRRGLERLLAQARNATAEDCPSLLAQTTGGLPAAQRASLSGVEVTSVRAKGDRGLAFYTDADGGGHSLPIRRERGRWAIASVLTANNFNRHSPTRSSQ